MADPSIDVRIALVEQNYQTLDKRIEKVEAKLDQLSEEIKDGNHSLIKVIVGAAASILAGAISVVVAILMKF